MRANINMVKNSLQPELQKLVMRKWILCYANSFIFYVVPIS